MKQAILLLVHTNVGQVKRLVSYFGGQCDIYIHVDRGGGITPQERKELADLPGVRGVYAKYNVHWAGFSILRAEMFLLEKALATPDVDYLHLLSGQDYPIRPLSDFLYFFSHTPAKGYVNCQHLPCPDTDGNTYYRMQHFVLSDYMDTKDARGKRKVWKLVEWQRRHGIRRRIPDYLDHLYGGSAWFSLGRDVAQYLVDYTRKHPSFFRRMRWTYIPEEIYVPSVVLNSPYRDGMVSNNNCRTILWNYEAIDCSPKNVATADFRDLLGNPIGFFSRKFEMPESGEVMGLVDRHLLAHHDFEILDSGGWVNPHLDGYEFDGGLSRALIRFCHDLRLSRVCDFGCGPGWYVANMRGHGISAVGYDLNPHTAELADLMSGGTGVRSCAVADLTEELSSRDGFDVVLFLSVGQYIPRRYEDVVFGNLRRNARRYVILSWGSPRHGGRGYVNALDGDAIVERMCRGGEFVHNEFASRSLASSCTLPFYRETLMVFQKV